MMNLCSQPFLLSLEQAAEQTDNYTDYETLLQKQQIEFLKYLENIFDSGISAPKRFQFLRTADVILESILLMYRDVIKKHDADFHRFWSMLITNTRRYVSIGIEMLEFQSHCPAQMLAEPEQSHTFPLCKWTANHKDLMELIVGVFQIDVIRLQDGSRPSFALFAKAIGSVLGIDFNHPHNEMQRVLNRKKDQTPFLHRMIECMKSRRDKMDE
jgi:hypothetical protein